MDIPSSRLSAVLMLATDAAGAIDAQYPNMRSASSKRGAKIDGAAPAVRQPHCLKTRSASY
jgi:hypothetical protein